MSIAAAKRKSAPAPAAGLEPAIVVGLPEPGKARVRFAAGSGAADARLAQIAGYRPAEGDRVLVAAAGTELFVVAVVCATHPLGLPLDDGGAAELRGGALEIRDADGRLRVRYEGGEATIAAPAGDLTLEAPNGRIALRSGLDVTVEAARDVTHRAGRTAEIAGGAARLSLDQAAARLDAPAIAARTQAASLAADKIDVLARSIATTAKHAVASLERYELSATRIVEKARDTFRDATGLSQARVGRARTLVGGLYSLVSRRTTLASKEETSVDGKKILLG